MKIYWFLFRPQTYGVSCIILHKDKVLLVKHTYGKKLWSTVGGGIKTNESPKQAILREVKEEIGLKLKTVKKVGVIHYEKEYKKDTIHIFLTNSTTTKIKIDYAEIAEANWFPVHQLPKKTSPIFKKLFDLANSQ